MTALGSLNKYNTFKEESLFISLATVGIVINEDENIFNGNLEIKKGHIWLKILHKFTKVSYQIYLEHVFINTFDDVKHRSSRSSPALVILQASRTNTFL